MINVDYVKGDLIEMIKSRSCDVAAHGCNCFHTMGAGIARQLNELTVGDLILVDKETEYGDINKLGFYSTGYYVKPFDQRVVPIHNLYTQYTTAKSGCVAVHWDSVFDALLGVLETMESGETLAIPYIGCGLAGGSIEDFKSVIDELKDCEDSLPHIKLLVVEYEK